MSSTPNKTSKNPKVPLEIIGFYPSGNPLLLSEDSTREEKEYHNIRYINAQKAQICSRNGGHNGFHNAQSNAANERAANIAKTAQHYGHHARRFKGGTNRRRQRINRRQHNAADACKDYTDHPGVYINVFCLNAQHLRNFKIFRCCAHGASEIRPCQHEMQDHHKDQRSHKRYKSREKDGVFSNLKRLCRKLRRNIQGGAAKQYDNQVLQQKAKADRCDDGGRLSAG